MVDPRKLNPESTIGKAKQSNLQHRIPNRLQNWWLHVPVEVGGERVDTKIGIG